MATKSLVLRVRVTDVLMAALEEESKRQGVSVSKLVRARLEGRPVAPERVLPRGFAIADVPAEVAAPLVEEAEDALERVRGYELPSAAQVGRRSFKPDFK